MVILNVAVIFTLLEFKCLFDCWSLSFFDVCRQG